MRERISTKHQACKRKRHSDSEVDWFSLLTDDTIASILSRLSLKDAVRTSVLSHRWEKLWAQRFGNNIVLCHENVEFYPSSYNFVKWVNRILKSSKNEPVNEFAIRFRLDSRYSKTVKSWIAFALKKDVTRLHLDMSPINSNPCVFPDARKLSNSPSLYSNLKDIHLCEFRIDEILFHRFLSKCPSLKLLYLRGIYGLKHLIAINQTLECLEVIRCPESKVVVSASNLMSLSYDGTKKCLKMRSAPRLMELSVGTCTEEFVEEFARNFRYSTQLTTLKLKLSIEMIEKSISYPQPIAAFTELKHLVITMDLDKHHSLLWLICLIKAAPLLSKFEVKMGTWLNKERLWCDKFNSPNRMYMWDKPPRYTWNEKYSRDRNVVDGHKYLKVAVFHGFANLANQWDLVKHVVEITESLEEMILYLDVSQTPWRVNTYMTETKTAAERLVAPPTKLTLRNSTKLSPFLARFLLH